MSNSIFHTFRVYVKGQVQDPRGKQGDTVRGVVHSEDCTLVNVQNVQQRLRTQYPEPRFQVIAKTMQNG